VAPREGEEGRARGGKEGGRMQSGHLLRGREPFVHHVAYDEQTDHGAALPDAGHHRGVPVAEAVLRVEQRRHEVHEELRVGEDEHLPRGGVARHVIEGTHGGVGGRGTLGMNMSQKSSVRRWLHAEGPAAGAALALLAALGGLAAFEVDHS
jgi:hypothetical protein